MPEIDPKLAAYGTDVLRKRRGAEIRTGSKVQAIEPGKVDLPGETIEAETVVLAAGIIPNPVVAELPVERDRRGRIVVDGTMRCKSHPEVWALGDCAAVPAPDGQPYPSLAQHAMREAKVLARNIEGVLRGRPPQPFVYSTLGMMGSLGHRKAFGQAHQDARARRPGMACPPHVLLASDAGLAPASTHHDRLDLCAVVSAGHRQDQPGQRRRRTTSPSELRQGGGRSNSNDGFNSRCCHGCGTADEGVSHVANHGPRQSAGLHIPARRKVGGALAAGAGGCWKSTINQHRKPLLRVDLTEVTFIDDAGKTCLAAMYRQGAELVAADCLTRDIVAEITQERKRSGE